MGCTTILVGKKASADGSTIMARTDDSGHGSFEAKRFEVIAPEDLPKTYRSVLSHVEIPLPETGLRYTRFPDADTHKGLWAGAGINSARVSMTATETLTSNERVLGADPLVELREAQGEEGQDGFVPEQPGGIGEEDMVVLVLPYIKTAREGVLRLGKLLQQYGTYEMNGIGFADNDDVWWLETVGGIIGWHGACRRNAMPSSLTSSVWTTSILTMPWGRDAIICARRICGNSWPTTTWIPRKLTASRLSVSILAWLSGRERIRITPTTRHECGRCSGSSIPRTCHGLVSTGIPARIQTTWIGA